MAHGSIKIPWKSPTPFNAERKRAFCEHFAKSHLWTESAHVAGVDYATAKAHFRDDPEFRAAVEVAKKQHLDSIEKAIHSRGVTGWYDETVTYDEDGKEKRKSKKYRASDELLKLYAKRHMKAYRNPTPPALSPTINVNTQVNVDFVSLAPAQREALRAFIAASPSVIVPQTEPPVEPGPTNGQKNGDDAH